MPQQHTKKFRKPDLCIANISSTVLRSTNWAIEGLDATTTHKEIKKAWPLGFFEGNQAAFCDKCIKASTQEAPPSRLRPRGATVVRLTPDQKVACSNHVGVRWSLIGVKCLIWTVSFYLAIRSPKKMETWMPKLKQISFEPESNQRSKDSQHFIHSALLYQLIYRKMGKPQATTTDQEIQKT